MSFVARSKSRWLDPSERLVGSQSRRAVQKEDSTVKFVCEGCKKTLFGGVLGAAKLKCVRCGAIQCAKCAQRGVLDTKCCKCGAAVKEVND